MSNPLIQIIPTLSPSEVETVNHFLDNNGVVRQKNTVFTGTSFQVNTSFRSSEGFTLSEENSVTQLIGASINKALLDYTRRLAQLHTSYVTYTLAPGSGGTRSHREGIQVLEYKKGQEYKFHYDQNWHRNQETFYRTISVVLYLNSEFEGGGTEFPDTVYKPKPGEALIFPSSWCFPHRGQPVISGMKRVAVTWYYVYPAS
jgi:hypothetical protein